MLSRGQATVRLSTKRKRPLRQGRRAGDISWRCSYVHCAQPAAVIFDLEDGGEVLFRCYRHAAMIRTTLTSLFSDGTWNERCLDDQPIRSISDPAARHHGRPGPNTGS